MVGSIVLGTRRVTKPNTAFSESILMLSSRPKDENNLLKGLNTSVLEQAYHLYSTNPTQSINELAKVYSASVIIYYKMICMNTSLIPEFMKLLNLN